jgi:hypothetical protein
MKVRLISLGVTALGCAAAIASSAAVASADPPDPHQPELTRNYCPGGTWGFGRLRVCDGEKYTDGSYWHQWNGNQYNSSWHYDCVGGDEPLPAPPPAGGCAGAIPPEQPEQPAPPSA